MEKILRNTALISFLTLCSRVLGVIRDACIAMMFGTSAYSDAFFVAFRPFDFIRKMFSEGILGISFVPVFSGILETRGRAKAFEFVFSFFCFLSLAGILMMLLGLLFGPLVLKVIAPGFSSGTVEYHLTLVLFRTMLPYFWFIMITALCMGILNSFDRFAAPAAAPVIFNLSIITFTLFISKFFETPVWALAFGVISGGVLQLAIQVPVLVKLKCFGRVVFKLFHSKTWKIIKIMGPSMVGAASYQINIMTASFFASTLAPGSVSFLYYADRLVQFPLALFTVSAATVFLPELAKKTAVNQLDQVGDIFTGGVRLVLFITIPAMAGLMALNKPVVALLFARGLFDAQAVQHTSECLFFLVTGLWAFACVRLFVTLHFAIQSIKIPFLSGIFSMVLNLVLCTILIRPFGLNGLVIAVAVSAAAAFIFLCLFPPGNVKPDLPAIGLSACRSVFLSVIMFFLVKLALQWVETWQAATAGSAGGTLFCIGSGMAAYLAGSLLMAKPELKLILRGLKKRSK